MLIAAARANLQPSHMTMAISCSASAIMRSLGMRDCGTALR